MQIERIDVDGWQRLKAVRMGFEQTGETGSLSPPREHVMEHRRALYLAGR